MFLGKRRSRFCFYAGLAARSKDAFDLAVGAKKADVLFEIPFDPERRRNSVLVTGASCNELVVRGAPESVLSAVALTAAERAEVETWIKTQGQSGARTLAIAKKTIVASRYQASDESHGLEFVGVIAFVDPIKPSTKTAILDAARLGIKIKVITGDSLEVAGAVAHQIGLIDRPDAVITGTMLSAMSALEKQTAVEAHHVFARVSRGRNTRLFNYYKLNTAWDFWEKGSTTLRRSKWRMLAWWCRARPTSLGKRRILYFWSAICKSLSTGLWKGGSFLQTL